MSAMLVAGVATQGFLAAHGAPGAPADRIGDQRPLRVLTYNIHHGEGTDREFDLPRLAAIVRGLEPDLVALQEVDQGTRRAGGVDQLAELARLTGMHGVFGKAMDFQEGGYGVGVLSRQPVLRSENQPLPSSADREPRTALTVEVNVGGTLVQFTSTHLDQGRETGDKLAQVGYLNDSLTDRLGNAAILAGDMNTRPDTEVMQLLTERWTDMFRDPSPVDINGRIPGRVDYVLVRPGEEWRTVEARVVDAPVASDHRPVLVVLEWLGATESSSRVVQ